MILPRHEAKHVWIGDKRHYLTPDGQTYPGVTTILSATKDMRVINQWRDRIGAEQADKIRDDAASRGTATHLVIEQVLQWRQAWDGSPPDLEVSEQAAPYWESIRPVIDRIQNPRLMEGAVWHPLGYAGSVDAVAELDGVPCILDWKTADKPKREDYIKDYFAQVAGYCAAVNRVYYNDLDELYCNAAVVIAIPGREAQVFKLNHQELSWQWKVFQSRVRAYNVQKKVEMDTR